MLMLDNGYAFKLYKEPLWAWRDGKEMLTKDLSSVPNTTWQFTSSYNFSSRDWISSSDFYRYQAGIHMVHIH